jgi:nitroimidazol reductase NimA-like FMN-containing flavoprotein (pyridoxamine 5'-phosphate oxidase superfamily)
MTPNTPAPTFHDLDASEVSALLARNHIGRIAYSFHDRVDIEPISYVFADGGIYMRTAPGSKLLTLAHVPWVAFEVDEVRGPFDWRSVVAHGTVYMLHDGGSAADRATYRRAVERLRELTPNALDHDDPVPMRRVVVKLYPASLVGREARTGTIDRQADPPQRTTSVPCL